MEIIEAKASDVQQDSTGPLYDVAAVAEIEDEDTVDTKLCDRKCDECGGCDGECRCPGDCNNNCEVPGTDVNNENEDDHDHGTGCKCSGTCGSGECQCSGKCDAH